MYLRFLTGLQTVFGLADILYLKFFYELDPRRGSGCYTYTNRKGQVLAKCSLESATCYTQGWPDAIDRGNASRLCTEGVRNT